MEIDDNLQNLILYDRKYIFEKIKKLQKKLDIDKKLNTMVNFIDDIDYLFLSNLDLNSSPNEILNQIKNNAEKNLELRCVIDGKKRYIKSYGLVKNISRETLKDLSEFLILIKLSKKIAETSYFASQYYRVDKLFNELKIN